MMKTHTIAASSSSYTVMRWFSMTYARFHKNAWRSLDLTVATLIIFSIESIYHILAQWPKIHFFFYLSLSLWIELNSPHIHTNIFTKSMKKKILETKLFCTNYLVISLKQSNNCNFFVVGISTVNYIDEIFKKLTQQIRFLYTPKKKPTAYTFSNVKSNGIILAYRMAPLSHWIQLSFRHFHHIVYNIARTRGEIITFLPIPFSTIGNNSLIRARNRTFSSLFFLLGFKGKW